MCCSFCNCVLVMLCLFLCVFYYYGINTVLLVGRNNVVMALRKKLMGNWWNFVLYHLCPWCSLVRCVCREEQAAARKPSAWRQSGDRIGSSACGIYRYCMYVCFLKPKLPMEAFGFTLTLGNRKCMTHAVSTAPHARFQVPAHFEMVTNGSGIKN